MRAILVFRLKHLHKGRQWEGEGRGGEGRRGKAKEGEGKEGKGCVKDIDVFSKFELVLARNTLSLNVTAIYEVFVLSYTLALNAVVEWVCLNLFIARLKK